MDDNVFIALEGLSGVGKTTIGKILSKELGAIFYKTPAKIFSAMRKEIDEKADPTARFFFYLASVVQASTEISKKIRSHSVICDRYLLTTLCWHKVIAVEVASHPQFLDKTFIKIPDFTFLITCEETQRISRLYKRGLSFNDKQERKNGLENKLLKEYQIHQLIEIDNSLENNPFAAVKKILAYIT